jgi:5-hydroxyisourate hydrolase-like protein (transthyretin family)
MYSRFINLPTSALLSTFALPAAAGTPTEVSEIELRRLFDPTVAELSAEEKGRIYIYEGVRDIDVQRALDEEFHRVENMMFIRTQKTDEEGKVKRDTDTGEAETEDDGC